MTNSIKQLLRTPFKVILFFLLIVMSTAIMVSGFQLWRNTNLKLNEMEGEFTTIATVTQIEDSMETVSTWDAAFQMYSHADYPVYNKIVPISVLQFEGANYIRDPQKRPYYGAYLPEYKKMFEDSGSKYMDYVVEFSPVEDCKPDKPVRVNVVNMLSGESYGSKQLWYCDHYTENPQPLYADKTYIARLLLIENTHTNVQVGTQIEFTPLGMPINSTQYDKDGSKLESELNTKEHQSCEEVTDDFYQTGRGRYWINYTKFQNIVYDSIPVLPTEGLELLPAFHEGEAAIINGRDITLEEYKDGGLVCLITSGFAQNNNLKVGDSIILPLLFANYNTEPGYQYGYGYGFTDFSLQNAQGELYPVFWEAEYEIVGTYKYSGGKSGGSLGRTEMARDMVIIPSKSVKASDENNIVDFGPMREFTTSFQIPNGTISEYEAAFQKKVPESSLLQITYDDNGYEQISGNLESTRNIAILLGSIGVFSTLAILMLLLYFFVIKQKKRTAIERSLGLSRRQCRISIISGVMLITAIATTAGSVGSSFLLDRIPTTEEVNQTGYSTMYSSWAMDSTASDQNESNETATTTPIWYINLAVPAILFFFMLISSVLLVNKNLAIEPIMLLSTKGD